MTLNFPTNPALDATYEYQGIVYTWDGEKWDASAPLVVGTNNLVDGSVTTPKIADDAVTEQKISLVGGSVVGYQQGIWTPYATTISDSLNTGVSDYNSQNANWTRIGQTITATFWLQAASAWSYINGMSQSSIFLIAGLPYQVRNDPPFSSASGVISYIQGNNADYQFRCYPQYGSPVSYIVFVNDSTTSSPSTDISSTYGRVFGNNSSGIQGSVTYITDDTTWQPINGATVS